MLRLLGSSMMNKQNWSLAFLFSVEWYGFKAFECGLIAASLIRLWSVDFSYIHNSRHWSNIGMSTKRNFWNLVEIYLDLLSSNTFWKFTIHISNKILKLRSFTLLPYSSNCLGAGRHSSGNVTYAASSQLSILTFLEQFFKRLLDDLHQ